MPPVASSDVREANRRIARARHVIACSRDDPFGGGLGLAEDIPRANGFVAGEQHEPLDADRARGLDHVLGAEDIRRDTLYGIGLDERHVLVRGRVKHDVRAISGDDVDGARRASNVGENWDGVRRAPFVPASRHQVDERAFCAVYEHEPRGPRLRQALGESRAEEASGARNQDSGALEVLSEFVGSQAVDQAAEERFRVRLVCDLGATKLLSERRVKRLAAPGPGPRQPVPGRSLKDQCGTAARAPALQPPRSPGTCLR